MAEDPYALIELAEAAHESAEKIVALKGAISSLSASGEATADRSYALGYSWYLMPEDTDERKAETHRHLVEALRLDPEHRYARLYLAHHYFDTDQFEAALRILLEFDAQEFAEQGQGWRDVKVAELILGCSLELLDAAQVTNSLNELLARASRVNVDDLPAPTELARVLHRLIALAR